MVEGSLWVYGRTSLVDYYADRIGLRELANRLLCLPHEAPIHRVLEAEDERAEAQRQAADIENVLATFQKG